MLCAARGPADTLPASWKRSSTGTTSAASPSPPLRVRWTCPGRPAGCWPGCWTRPRGMRRSTRRSGAAAPACRRRRPACRTRPGRAARATSGTRRYGAWPARAGPARRRARRHGPAGAHGGAVTASSLDRPRPRARELIRAGRCQGCFPSSLPPQGRGKSEVGKQATKRKQAGQQQGSRPKSAGDIRAGNPSPEPGIPPPSFPTPLPAHLSRPAQAVETASD